jgi:hypothetical protein
VVPNIRARTARRYRRIRGSVFVATAAALVIAILLLPGVSLGATASRVGMRFAAPYSATGLGFEITSSNGCGGTGSLPVAPNFNNLTGVGVTWAKARAPSCGATYDNYTITDLVGLDSNNLPTMSGVHNVSSRSTLSFTANLSVISHSGALAISGFIVEGTLAVVDLTNGTSAQAICSPMGQVIGGNATFSRVYTDVSVSCYLDYHFKSSHVYQWEALVQISVILGVSAGKGLATGWVNMATHSQHAKIVSVTIH